MFNKTSSTLCPICNSTNICDFIEIRHIPVYCNLLWSTYDKAIHAPRGDMRLGFCNICGHIFNIAFEPERMEYTQEYENSLHFSPRFQEYAQSLATYLMNRYDLHHKYIIEIGCGKGDFLHMLCKLGDNRGIGFDPSYGQNRDGNLDNDQITFIQDVYSERYSHYQADFLCCRHVLEHIQYPRDFLHTIRRAIGNRPGTAVYFEVPNIMFMLKYLSIWDLIYEHSGYFCQCSLASLFYSCGFTVAHVQETFEGQFLGIEALPGKETSFSKKEYCDNMECMADYVNAFSDNYQSKLTEWQHTLKVMQQSGHKGIVWGAGSKGVTFLNTLKVQEQIKYIVDINPHKQGMYVAGTGQKIVSPEFLREYHPDTVIVMNPIYLKEIQHVMREMNILSKFIVV